MSFRLKVQTDDGLVQLWWTCVSTAHFDADAFGRLISELHDATPVVQPPPKYGLKLLLLRSGVCNWSALLTLHLCIYPEVRTLYWS